MSTEFKLPNGAYRSPDAAWITNDRWQSLTREQQESFPPLCPDFVVELRSKSNSLKDLRAKMQEYQDNGYRLGWLIDPQNQQVDVYRRNQATETLENPEMLSGEDVLPEFVLELRSIFAV